MSTVTVPGQGPDSADLIALYQAVLALQQVARASGEVNTAIATAGAGTLTGASIVGGVITRTGPTAAYTDTTDTAANIIAAAPNAAVNTAWQLTIKNTVAFPMTLAAGSGVTLSGQAVIPANSVGRFLVTYSGTGAVTILGLFVSPMSTAAPLAATSLATVGAGTISAAGIAGGLVQRSGAQANSNFTDTTDTAANIIAAIPNASVGQSFWFAYENQTNAAATLANGSSVTVSGVTVVPAGTWALFLVTVATSSTVTMAGFATGRIVDSALPSRTTTAPTNATNALSSGVLSDLALNVTAGQKVSGRFVIWAKNSTSGEGLQFDLNGGTATWTSIAFGFLSTPIGAALGVVYSTAIGTALTSPTANSNDVCYAIEFAGVVNAGGTLIPRFAENSTHTSGTATVELNSYGRIETTAN